ncbi:MAG TPA: hypothetical protein VGW58_00830, partial [Pyrinomonadaceae bacterium]|nr:hypothetical protein [Pyrinomonadaceae bacterium]
MAAQPQPQQQPRNDAEERRLRIRLESVLDSAHSISDSLDPLVSKYELKTSEFLFGTIGALLLML